MPTHVATRQGFPLTEWARHALPGPLFGFAIAGGPTLPHVPIAEGRSGQHIDSALLRHVLFASPAPARRSGRVRIRRSCPETAPGADPPAWLPRAPSERSTPLRSATFLRSAKPDRHIF